MNFFFTIPAGYYGILESLKRNGFQVRTFEQERPFLAQTLRLCGNIWSSKWNLNITKILNQVQDCRC
jgi:hypothetical protein